MNYMQVDSEDIKRLGDYELTKLLSLLLYNEANKFNLVKNSISVALNITVPDGGEDGHIRWREGIEKTDWIPSRYTLFQVKATDMPPSTCKQEVLGSNGLVKPRVEDVVNAQGTYILFHNRELNQQQIQQRIDAFNDSITSVITDATPSIEIYDASKIAQWCNQYISAIYAVWEWNGKHFLTGSKTWETWSGHKEFQSGFISTYETEQIIDDLRDYFKDEKKTARIIGLPGKGKTRLALEVFRSDTSIELKALNKSVIYIDASYSKESIVSSINSWRNLGISGIIVVDNCDYELHKLLKSEIEHIESKFSLLTLDYNLHTSISSDPLINLEDVPKEIIEGIIKSSYPEMDEHDLERIVVFADGFPSIATLLAEARINDFETIGSIQDMTLVNKLLWGRDPVDERALKVIEACAVFEHIGFEDEKELEMNYVAENICGITLDEFYEKCSYFIKKKIIVQHGRYIKLVPKTLAITLAAQWWEKCRPQKAQEILSDANLPSSMVEQLCNQISKLHFLEKAKELTSKLCGVQAPFGRAEILSSKIGSRIFCSFVEIDPLITVDTLEREFGIMSIDNLKRVKAGRRDLVRALEKLCFWEETCESAAKILARFAAAENESWANNATGQFNQLFHYTLSGTQANLESRVSIINWTLSSREKEIKKIGIGAVGHALKTQGFSRMIGVENQGSRPAMQEWKPRNWGEIFDYWNKVLSLLVELIIKEDDCSNIIFDVIVDNVFGLIRSGYAENMEQLLKVVFEKRNNYWPEFLEKINLILKFDEAKMPKKIVDLIKSWEKQLQPQDTITKIKLLVCNANNDYVENKDNSSGGSKYKDAALDRINELLEDIYPEKMDELKSNLSNLLIGEQKQAFYFGNQLANIMTDEERDIFLDLVYREIQKLLDSPEDQIVNLNFFGGVLSSIQLNNPNLLKSFLIKLDTTPYAHILGEIIRYIEVDEDILNFLLKYVRGSIINLDSLLSLAYGPALNGINEDKLIAFLEALYALDEGFNQVLVWKIYYRYYLNNNEITPQISRCLVRFLENSLAILSEQSIFYEVREILAQLYKLEFVEKEKLSRNLVINLLDMLSRKDNYSAKKVINEYIEMLIQYDPITSWEIISDKLLEAEGVFKYRLIEAMGHGFFKEDAAPVQNVPVEVLKEWAESDEKAAQILADIYPINTKEDADEDLIYFLIENYGGDETVLRNINRQLRTFSWSGSLIPYYEGLITFYKKYTNSQSHIRKWAVENIHYLEEDIRREKVREEEDKLRF
ncbi:hypothetical protein [Bacillus badius]|uniref:ATP-binding protein n=1 Tax=Bacillus badius TaxID=1455 RepID=A0ABR5AP67_BACBA|nr:hypothetical protein [Bacillus badius]KIL74127.1 hypothetical protein SD77_2983 [Bacillus badius]MED4717338.1 hypothetical protein [Bacillus badius]